MIFVPLGAPAGQAQRPASATISAATSRPIASYIAASASASSAFNTQASICGRRPSSIVQRAEPSLRFHCTAGSLRDIDETRFLSSSAVRP